MPFEASTALFRNSCFWKASGGLNIERTVMADTFQRCSPESDFAFIGARSVNGWHRHVQQPQVNRELAAMMHHVIHEHGADSLSSRHGKDRLAAAAQLPHLGQMLVAGAGDYRARRRRFHVEYLKHVLTRFRDRRLPGRRTFFRSKIELVELDYADHKAG